MEVHNADSKTSATAVALAGEAAKQQENGNGKATAACVTAANSSADDSKVKPIGPATSSKPSASGMLSFDVPMLLLEDSTLDMVPQYCNRLFTGVDHTQASQVELLMTLIYCVGLESGFATNEALKQSEVESSYWGSTFNARNINKLAEFPNNLRGNWESCTLKLSCYIFPNTKSWRLIGIQTGDSFIVTLTPETNAPGYSICLPISRYILSSVKSPNIAARFRNLRELANVLKDHVFMPAKIYLAQLCQCDMYLGLCGIPEEMVYLILRTLKMKDIQRLSKTCREMRNLCENYRILRRFRSAESIQQANPSISSFSLGVISNMTDY